MEMETALDATRDGQSLQIEKEPLISNPDQQPTGCTYVVGGEQTVSTHFPSYSTPMHRSNVSSDFQKILPPESWHRAENGMSVTYQSTNSAARPALNYSTEPSVYQRSYPQGGTNQSQLSRISDIHCNRQISDLRHSNNVEAGISYNNTLNISQDGYKGKGEVLKVEYGPEQIISESSRVDNSQARILRESVIEHDVVIPKKITREDIVEKIIVIPEKVVREEITEEWQKVREKIIEVAVPVIKEQIVEVPEITYVEKIVQVPQVEYIERTIEVPKIEYVERQVEEEKVIWTDKVVEVPVIEYVDVPVEKLVEVPEVVERLVYKQGQPQYIHVEVPEYKEVYQEVEVMREIPVPVEAVTTCQFLLPKIKPRYVKVDVPLYVPRFIEVPVAMDSMDSEGVAKAEHFARQVGAFVQQTAISLCEIETLAHEIKNARFENHEQSLLKSWRISKFGVDPVSLNNTRSETLTSTI